MELVLTSREVCGVRKTFDAVVETHRVARPTKDCGSVFYEPNKRGQSSDDKQ